MMTASTGYTPDDTHLTKPAPHHKSQCNLMTKCHNDKTESENRGERTGKRTSESTAACLVETIREGREQLYRMAEAMTAIVSQRENYTNAYRKTERNCMMNDKESTTRRTTRSTSDRIIDQGKAQLHRMTAESVDVGRYHSPTHRSSPVCGNRTVGPGCRSGARLCGPSVPQYRHDKAPVMPDVIPIVGKNSKV
jgi:hypothetical protein